MGTAVNRLKLKRGSRRRVGKMEVWRGSSSRDPLCSECPPQSPTRKCDRGNDADDDADAAEVAVMLPSSFLFSCRFPGGMVVEVVLGEARRIDDEAQLCFAWVVKTIWESTTQTRKCGSLVAAGFNQCGPHLEHSRPNICLNSHVNYKIQENKRFIFYFPCPAAVVIGRPSKLSN